MQTLILIIMLVSGLPKGGVDIHHVEFKSRESCERAKIQISSERAKEAKIEFRKLKLSLICVEQ